MTIKIIKGLRNADWYCAKDVFSQIKKKWMGEAKSLRALEEHQKATLSTKTSGGEQNILCVSIEGVKALINHYKIPIEIGMPFGVNESNSQRIKGMPLKNSYLITMANQFIKIS